MTCYNHLLDMLEQGMGGPVVNIAEYGAFRRELTRDEFVGKKVFGLALVAIGNGAEAILQTVAGA